MSRKIIYWLLPLLAGAIYPLLNKLDSVFGLLDFLDPKKFDSSLLWLLSVMFFYFLPMYLLFLCSCILGLKIFELPKPSVKAFIVGGLAAVFVIPLLFFISISASASHPWGLGRLEPLAALVFILSFLLDGLLILFIFGFRPPKRKCLFMCFLPALVYAVVGIALILISGTGFRVQRDYVYASMEGLSAIERQLYVLTAKYFADFILYFGFAESSFTLYWTMKYHHEQTEKAAAATLASPEGKLSA